MSFSPPAVVAPSIYFLSPPFFSFFFFSRNPAVARPLQVAILNVHLVGDICERCCMAALVGLGGVVVPLSTPISVYTSERPLAILFSSMHLRTVVTIEERAKQPRGCFGGRLKWSTL